MAGHTAPFGISHFAINAVDVERAMAFYSSAFGWKFTAWGPPGFYLIETGQGIHGALQSVQTSPVETRVGGFECTVSVEDVDASVAAIVAGGGSVEFPKSTIPGVGDIARVRDTEGNTFCVMKYAN